MTVEKRAVGGGCSLGNEFLSSPIVADMSGLLAPDLMPVGVWILDIGGRWRHPGWPRGGVPNPLPHPRGQPDLTAGLGFTELRSFR